MPSRLELMELGRRYASDPAFFLTIGENADGEKFVRSSAIFPDLPVANFSFAWAAEWARLAFPTIQPTHTYAAALMATVPPSDLEIRAPWPVFYLAIPDQLVTFLSPEGKPVPANGMLVYQAEERWTWLASAGPVEFTRLCYPLDAICELNDGDEPPAWDQLQLESEAHDERAAHCLSRLMVNACLAMSDPTAVRTVGKAHQWKPGMRLPETPRTFQLGRPVRVDCRQSVRDYVAGTSRLAAVQWLVRGHWRKQPHGPGHAQRRVQWLEPYWKGGEDAPLNVRDHLLK